MNWLPNRVLVVWCALQAVGVTLLGQTVAVTVSNPKQPLTVIDSIGTRKPIPGEIALSPDGRRVAYVVDAPDMENNRSNNVLYVNDLNSKAASHSGTFLVSSEQISGLKWLSDGKRVLILCRLDGTSRIDVITVSTGARNTLWSSRKRIMSMSASSDANTLAYSVNEPLLDARAKKDRQSRGYVIKFGESATDWGREDWWPNQRIYLIKRQPNGSIVHSQVCSSEFSSGSETCVIRGAKALSLSPDGRYLSFNYQRTKLPETWVATEFCKWARSNGIPVDGLGLYDLQTKQTTLGFDAPDAGFRVPAVWSEDSRAFAISALSPVATAWERRDIRNGFTEGRRMESYTHVFAVGVDGKVSEALQTPAVWSQSGILAWKHADSEMLIRKDNRTFARMVANGDEWRERRQFTPSFQGFTLRPSATSNGSPVVSDGTVMLGISETTMSPPEIYLYDVRTDDARALTELNPQFRDITLGTVEKIEWKNAYGANCGGYLIRPVGYVQGTRYPLVIMAKGWGDDFFTDTRFRTAFPPQSLANAGFVVLMANMPAPDSEPSSYPGRMGEAFNWISMVESGVAILEDLGLVDKNNVGIIGFSRTSWNVDFMITHSAFRFAAVSSSDSGLYNYGTYWFANDDRSFRDSEQQFGDAPYGKGFTTWLQYAPAFNAQHVHTPVLMEYCGYGVLPEPIGAEEFFVALNHYRKPVELYFYPLGEHMLETPRERVASLQRNVDWFRFWMQGYERPRPEDPEQYPRWRALRGLQEADRELTEGQDAK